MGRTTNSPIRLVLLYDVGCETHQPLRQIMAQPNLGPTVHEAAATLIRQCRAQIRDLEEEMAGAEYRLRCQNYANMLESERLRQPNAEVLNQRRPLFDPCHS